MIGIAIAFCMSIFLTRILNIHPYKLITISLSLSFIIISFFSIHHLIRTILQRLSKTLIRQWKALYFSYKKFRIHNKHMAEFKGGI